MGVVISVKLLVNGDPGKVRSINLTLKLKKISPPHPVI